MPEFVDLRPSELQPWPGLNPRRRIPEERIREYAASIADVGVLQNLVVQDAGEGAYRIIAGETRWRAATLAEKGCAEIGLDAVTQVRIPCRVVRLTEGEALKIAMLENIQSNGLNPIEKARGFARLIELNNWSQARVAEEMLGDAGKQPDVANHLRLLELPTPYVELIEDGYLGHTLARDHVMPLLRLDEDQRQPALDRLFVRIRGLIDDDEPVHGPWLKAQAEQITAAVAQEFGHPSLFEEEKPAAGVVRKCRVCGCTESTACDGGCSWADDPEGEGDICSACAAPAESEGGAGEETPAAPKTPEPTAEAEAPPPAPAPAAAHAKPAEKKPTAPAAAAPAPSADPVSVLPPPGTAREQVPEGAGFVTAVLTVTGRRPTTIALTPLPDGRVVLMVAPRPVKVGETPMAHTATPEELDAQLVQLIDTHFNI